MVVLYIFCWYFGVDFLGRILYVTFVKKIIILLIWITTVNGEDFLLLFFIRCKYFYRSEPLILNNPYLMNHVCVSQCCPMSTQKLVILTVQIHWGYPTQKAVYQEDNFFTSESFTWNEMTNFNIFILVTVSREIGWKL